MSIRAAHLEHGLYEELITRQLEDRLRGLTELDATTGSVDDADLPHVLARHISTAVERVLRATKATEQRLAMVNSLLDHLDAASEAVLAPPSQLLRVARPAGPGSDSMALTRPATPLSEAALLTNASGEPNLGAELRAEIDSSDEVDLLCAFVKLHGLRLLESELRRLQDRRAPFRLIATTYMGATERQALDRLVREFGG